MPFTANNNEDEKPKIVLVVSGKRKCGKDYVANSLVKEIGNEHCALIRLSGPLKKQYAAEHNLDYEELLKASNYKETYRLKMIQWGEEKRNKDPGFFCRLAVAQSNANLKDVWIISDARRLTDLEFFLKTYPSSTHLVRISASQGTRSLRGWTFVEGVDDAESECGLDDYKKWDFIINNDDVELCEELKPVLQCVNEKIT